MITLFMKNSFEQPITPEPEKKLQGIELLRAMRQELEKPNPDVASLLESNPLEDQIIQSPPVRKSITKKSVSVKPQFSPRTGAAAMDEWQRKQEEEQDRRRAA